MGTSAADLGDRQTKQCKFTPTWCTFLKSHTKDNAMVTSAADLGDLQTKPNNAYLPLHDIPFWKWQIKDNAMVTSAADLGNLQTKPNQTK